MSLKQNVITILEQNRGQAVSGQDLAERLGVSRAAVWKAVQFLKEEGWEIEAATKKGYCLRSSSDILSAEGFCAALGEHLADVTVLPKVDSTNTLAKKMAADGSPHGTVVMAEEQTAGRGRMGRQFYSPAKTGLYMSVILHPCLPVEESLKVTVAAAVAVCRAMERMGCQSPKIKWVNDIFSHGKKVCGILTEAMGDFESGIAESIVVGIGINVKTDDFPEELRNVAGSIGLVEGTRNALAAEIYRELMRLCQQLSAAELMEEYRRRSLVLGREISFWNHGRRCQGRVKEINDKGNLVIVTKTGIEILQAGEISLGSDALCQ